MKTITELVAAATKIDAQHYELQFWPNGIYFVLLYDALLIVVWLGLRWTSDGE